MTLLIVFYRPLADRFGRKPFLVINTFVMGLGLFLVYLSDNIYVYMIGSSLMGFMVSHDMQCVYILECSSEKKRARNYALIKAVAILGTLLIPLLRETLMQNKSERWHLVYLVPAILGFVLSLVALSMRSGLPFGIVSCAFSCWPAVFTTRLHWLWPLIIL